MAERNPDNLGYDDVDPAAREQQAQTVFQNTLYEAQLINSSICSDDYEGIEDDSRSDWQVVKDFAKGLNDKLCSGKARHARVYIRYSRCERAGYESSELVENIEDIDVREEYVRVEGFVPYRSESRYKDTVLQERERFELGLRVYTAARSNFSAQKAEGAVSVITVPLSDPMFGVELPAERFDEACDGATEHLEIIREVEALLAQNADEPLLFPRDMSADIALGKLIEELDLRDDTKIRYVAKLVTRCVNDPLYEQYPSLQGDIESILNRGFVPGRYKLVQNMAFQLTPESKEEVVGAKIRSLSDAYKPINKHSSSQLDGTLVGVTILPRINDRKKTLIPYFVLQPTAGDYLQIAPLENTTSIRRVSDAI